MDGYTAHQIVILGAKRDHEVSAIAAVAWMIWDTLINLEDEVQFLWTGHAKWVQWIYAFIRYVPIIHGGIVLSHYGTTGNSASRCRALIAYELSFLELLTIAVEIILVIRVFVLYKQNKVLKAFILTAFAAEVVSMMVLISFVIEEQTFTPDCIAATSPRIFIGYWLSSLAFETFLFVLTLAKCYRGSLKRRVARRRSVLFLFLRDGTWAFALIFVAMLLNTLMYQLNSTPRAGIGYYWELAVLSYAGSHVILNIRRLATPEYLSEADMSTLWDVSPDVTPDGTLHDRSANGLRFSVEMRRLSRAVVP